LRRGVFVSDQVRNPWQKSCAPGGSRMCRTYGACDRVLSFPVLTRWANLCRASGAGLFSDQVGWDFWDVSWRIWDSKAE
jgi:hypothetical protein